MILNMNGGGGGTGKLFAAIGVTYPAGSTCTCTNGTKTLTAKDTSGQCVFSIPSTGTWTVTATDGTETASETVEITTEGQSASVSLGYYTAIYNYGEAAHKLVVFNDSDGVHTITLNNSAMAWTIAEYSRFNFSTEEKIDVTDYSRLAIFYNVTAGATTNVDRNKFGLIGSTGDIINANFVASQTFETTTGEHILSVDISACSGEYYVSALGLTPRSSGTVSMDVYYIRLYP